ncbi:hypothetical protein GCM10009841_06480 [Microlunatus panaciterrae]
MVVGSPSVFLSYRRAESQHLAGRLADLIQDQFPGTTVFLDVESIAPATDFAAEIEHAVAGSAVMIAVIGPTWATTTDQTGVRRIMDPGDFVAQELRAASARGIPVLPLLDVGARMPTRSELPGDLQGFSTRQAIRLHRDVPFAHDMAPLLTLLHQRLAQPGPAGAVPPPRPRSQPARPRWVAALTVGLAVLLVLAGLGYGAYRLATPLLQTYSLSGRWRADTTLSGTSIDLYRVDRLRNVISLQLLLRNRGSDAFTFAFPYGTATVVDDANHSYDPDPFQTDWQTSVPAGAKRNVTLRLDGTLEGDPRSLTLHLTYQSRFEDPGTLRSAEVVGIPVPQPS